MVAIVALASPVRCASPASLIWLGSSKKLTPTTSFRSFRLNLAHTSPNSATGSLHATIPITSRQPS